jgi:hypothetical protein
MLRTNRLRIAMIGGALASVLTLSIIVAQQPAQGPAQAQPGLRYRRRFRTIGL